MASDRDWILDWDLQFITCPRQDAEDGRRAGMDPDNKQSCLNTIRAQARRYMEAAYGEGVWFKAPEALPNVVEQWIWAIASEHEGTVGEQALASIEGHMREVLQRASREAQPHALRQRARDMGRDILAGGMGWRGSLYGAVAATYPEGSRAARRDSWQCHHEHPDEASALECALAEVQRLALGGAYRPCSDSPGCPSEGC